MKKVISVVLVVAFAAVLAGCTCPLAQKADAKPAAEKPAAVAPESK